MQLHDEGAKRRYRQDGHWGETTLLDVFDRHVASHPDAVAIADPDDRPDLVGSRTETLTWSELGRAVDALATALKRRGLGPDEVVMAQLPNVWELPALYLAVARAGGVLSPLPMQWRERDIRYIADLTGARLFVAPERFKGTEPLALARSAAPGLEVLSLDEVSELAAGDIDVEVLSGIGIGADDVFSLCWTSGTEAEPKGCPMTHNNWLFQAGLMVDLLHVPEGGSLLATPPIVNMTGVGVVLVPWLVTGGSLRLHHPLNLELLLKQMTAGVSFTILVPALLNMLVKHPQVDSFDFSGIGVIGTGSAPPSRASLEEFKRRWGIEIVNIWGQNEGTGLVAGPDDIPALEQRVDHFPWWGRSDVTWPSGIEGVEIQILDEEDRPLSEPQSVGELAYRGPNVFPGYFGRHDLTVRAFTDQGFFRTGDLFQILDDRHLSFFDRKKDIIIRGGFNISAAEVENVALAHPGILEAAAVAVPDDIMGEKVCLFVVPQDASNPPTLEDVTGFMQQQGMAVYKLPERLEIIESLPRNPVGKLLKFDLREEAKQRMG